MARTSGERLAKASIPIEDGITIPEVKKRTVYPWAALKIGQSFLTHAKTPNHLSTSKTLAQAKTGFRFTIRRTPHGVRVWRIA